MCRCAPPLFCRFCKFLYELIQIWKKIQICSFEWLHLDTNFKRLSNDQMSSSYSMTLYTTKLYSILTDEISHFCPYSYIIYIINIFRQMMMLLCMTVLYLYFNRYFLELYILFHIIFVNDVNTSNTIRNTLKKKIRQI